MKSVQLTVLYCCSLFIDAAKTDAGFPTAQGQDSLSDLKTRYDELSAKSTWKSRDQKYSVAAVLYDCNNTYAFLRTEDREISVPLSRLSKNDVENCQEWVSCKKQLSILLSKLLTESSSLRRDGDMVKIERPGKPPNVVSFNDLSWTGKAYVRSQTVVDENEPAARNQREQVDGELLVKPILGKDLQWRYTFQKPVPTTAVRWDSGTLPASNDPGKHGGVHWPGLQGGKPDVWLEASLELERSQLGRLTLWGQHDDAMRMWANGTTVYERDEWLSHAQPLKLKQSLNNVLRPGDNRLAVHVNDRGGGAFVDLKLVEDPTVSYPDTGQDMSQAGRKLSDAVKSFLKRNCVAGATFGVSREGRMQTLRGFGWSDKKMTKPMQPTAILRLASNDKIVTRSAAELLQAQRVLVKKTGRTFSVDLRVVHLLNAYGISSANGKMDPRWRDVTIKHLLDHQSGVQGLSSPDEMRQTLGVEGPMSPRRNAAYMLSCPLNSAPGEKYSYSSSGYFLVRLIIHLVTGDLDNYLREQVFGPCGSNEIAVAAEALELRHSREPFYATFQLPYERHANLEHYFALSSSADGMLRYLRHYYFGTGLRLVDPSSGKWSTGPDNGSGVFFGGMAGTATVAVQRRHDQVNFVLLCNQSVELGEITETLTKIIDRSPAKDWR